MSIKGFNISGTTYKVDYPELDNLPQINGNDLVGNMSGASLGLSEVAGVPYLYGTNAQIETMLNSGRKIVYVDVPVNGLLNPRTRCLLFKRTSSTEHHFATTTRNACVYAMCKDDSWSYTIEQYARPSQFPDAALTLPNDLGVAAIGTSMDYARADHVHAMPAAEDVGAIPNPTTKSSGQVLTYNGYSWVASTPSGGGAVVDSELSTTSENPVQNKVIKAALDSCQSKSITDTGGYYTTDTVEGALQEIGAELASKIGYEDDARMLPMTLNNGVVNTNYGFPLIYNAFSHEGKSFFFIPQSQYDYLLFEINRAVASTQTIYLSSIAGGILYQIVLSPDLDTGLLRGPLTTIDLNLQNASGVSF